ncbi:MAG: DNA-processing protein DprA [Patescibacteria group bacterium]|nr:DNA-processing protein DprA [Patescibacteria group bacterium]
MKTNLCFKEVNSDSSSYPSRLLDLPNPPPVLYIAGEIVPSDSLALAVVGSRKMSSYGEDVCEEIVSQVSQAGVTIVSGLMYGVDLTAHKVALQAGGRTLGVLGFGKNFIHKVGDKNVVAQMMEGAGAIITEFGENEAGAPWTFPKRDRIISALASAILVVEAAEKSGTLYTIEAALKLKKEVMAIPGSIFSPVSKGTNKLIREGARLVCSVDEILEVLDVDSRIKKIAFKSEFPLSSAENAILEVLKEGELYIDDVAVKANMVIYTVSALLTSLELKGMVKDVGRGVYRRI